MRVDLHAADKDVLIARIAVLVTVRLLHSAGKFGHILPTDCLVVDVFRKLAHQGTLLVIAGGRVMGMFFYLTVQFLMRGIAAFIMAVARALRDRADQPLLEAGIRVLVGGDSAVGLALHGNGRQHKGIGRDKHDEGGHDTDGARPETAESSIS